MSRDVGVSQASLSRVERGVQEPGRRLVAAIAAHPEVNDTWLYTGTGDPITRVWDAPPGQTWYVPVVTRVLPGPPDDYVKRVITGMIFPVATPHYGDTRYFLSVSSRVGLAPAEELLLDEGDLLLMETDARTWTADEGLLMGKFCGARVKVPGGIRFVLGAVGMGRVFHPMEKLDFSSPGDVSDGGKPETAAAGIATFIEPSTPVGPWPLPTAALVAVCILLIRTFVNGLGDPRERRGSRDD